jgi:uncharacterized protein (UPF0332 family)
MRDFGHYISTNDVRKQSPDKLLAASTLQAAKDRLRLAQAIHRTQDPKFVVENCYEAILEAINSILYAKGYASYSHEASIAYLDLLDLPASGVDKLRKHRNGIKYYGEGAMATEAERALTLAESMITKLESFHPA